jgi:hypothetical protein
MNPTDPMERSNGGPATEDDLEGHLKQFRLRQPAALTLERRRRRSWLIAASFATLIVVGGVVVSEWRRVPVAGENPSLDGGGLLTEGPQLSVTIRDLTSALNDGPEQLDAVLGAVSRQLLPDVEREESTLERLSGM